MTIFIGDCKKKTRNAFDDVTLPETVVWEEVILTVYGIRGIGKGDRVYLDMETIRAFPSESFSTYDPWDKKTHTFTGVNLWKLLQRLGMDSGEEVVKIIAKNGYTVMIRAGDIREYGYLLAYVVDDSSPEQAGDYVKRGNLAIAIDFDRHTKLDREVYKYHLVWQVVSISVDGG